MKSSSQSTQESMMLTNMLMVLEKDLTKRLDYIRWCKLNKSIAVINIHAHLKMSSRLYRKSVLLIGKSINLTDPTKQSIYCGLKYKN